MGAWGNIRPTVIAAVAAVGASLGLAPAAQATDQAPAPVYEPYMFTGGSSWAGTSFVPGSNCDDCYVDVALPFDFQYMGVTYPAGTTLHVGSNGTVSFDTLPSGADYTNVCLPDTLGVPHGAALFPLWDDLDSSTAPTEGIFTSVAGGTAPYRAFVIEWRTQRHSSGSPGDVNFAVVLWETFDRVEFVYKAGSGASATVGIQQGDLGGAYQLECNAGGISPPDGVEYTPQEVYIHGIAEQGQALSASPVTFTGSPTPALSWQWERCGSRSSLSSCSPITGATGSTYVPVAADVGQYLRAKLIATNPSGSASAVSQAADATAPAPPPAPLYTVTAGSGTAIIPGTSDTGNHADEAATSVTLPFPVTIYGRQYTSAHALSNGSLSFTSAVSYSGAGCMPNKLGTDAIDAYQMDLRTDTPGSGVYTRVLGTTPHRMFVLEWRATYYGDDGKTANFEIVLSEDSPVISVIYGASADSGAGAVAGIQHDFAGPSTEYSCSKAMLTKGKVLRYAPSQPQVKGAVVQGGTVTYTTASFSGIPPPTVTGQWERCDAQGARCGPIAGARGASYALTAADVGHTVRVRQTATNASGSGTSESQPSAVIKAISPPVVSHLALIPARFAAAHSGGSAARTTGSKVEFHLSAKATVRFTVKQRLPGRRVIGKCLKLSRSNRKKPHCTRVRLLVGSFTFNGHAGDNALHFTGRLRGRVLKPGSYFLVATPTGTTHLAGRAVSASFQIIR